MHTSNVRRASLPCFCTAFEPTALVRMMMMMMEHRGLRTEEKVTITSAASWLDQSEISAPAGKTRTLDPTCTGSEPNSLRAALFYILLQKARLTKKARVFQTTLTLPTADQLFSPKPPKAVQHKYTSCWTH